MPGRNTGASPCVAVRHTNTIIPEPYNPLAYDRYQYVYSNPVRYTDSSGHCIDGITTVACILGGAMIVGAVAGYAFQVADNRSYGLDWGEALTTNISGEKIAAGAIIAGGVVVGAVAAGTIVTAGAAALGLTASAACADGDCTNEAQTAASTGKSLFEMVSKTDARAALRAGIEGLTKGQVKQTLDVLGQGKMDSVSLHLFENGNSQVTTQVLGGDGGSFARYVYTIDPSGKIIGLMQYAYNKAGDLMYVHDKLSDKIIK